ncbi:MAG: Gfo/Idh/MocA family oxidoreductase [Candidatus Lokiarchaeota archaeon]|nr:Gfo/Idh/MocA family oxidoreductase [Candidatus Lokiarchaeota archaeon]
MLRVGIIGCGDIANLNVLGYLRSQETELVAVSDTNLKIAGNKLERWGLRTVPIYEDYEKMIDREDLDIVEILTPHHLHAPMTEYCAKAGVPGISVQKPMAHTITDCESMIRVCNEENVKLKLFENFRFYPVYLRAKELLDQGIIGEPLNFRINTITMGGPGMPVDMTALIWRRNIDKCGGGLMIYDDGIHKFSMALWLMDQEKVDELYSWIDYFSTVRDSPSLIFWKYPSKELDDPPKYGSMQFTLAPNVYYPSNYYDCDEFIEISGTKGMMWLNQCTCGGNIISKTPQYPPIVVYCGGEVKTYGEELPRDWRYSFINSTEHFISAIQEESDPIYTAEQGKNLSIFAKMPFISTQQKRIVRWDEITPENEQNGSCSVKELVEVDGGIFRKYLKSVRTDRKKGIQEGLEHKEFKYQYEL